MIIGRQRIPMPSAGLQALRYLEGKFGGSVLSELPGNMSSLRSPILGADEIIFNIGEGGIRAGSLTAQELQLIVSEGILDRVTFVTGLTY